MRKHTLSLIAGSLLGKRSTNLAITHKSMMHLDWQLVIQQQDLLSE